MNSRARLRTALRRRRQLVGGMGRPGLEWASTIAPIVALAGLANPIAALAVIGVGMVVAAAFGEKEQA